jgi:cell division protein FtsB
MSYIGDTFGKIVRSSGPLLLIIGMFIYFSYFTIRGDRGLIRYVRLSDEVSQARQVSEKYATERADWEEKVKLLSPESLDLDMLDERAHIVLNMVGAQEFVILDDTTTDSER